MGVTQGPETVFDRPPAAIMPELTDAIPTGSNGRVGNELVFWGYELADGRSAYFFACALIEGVNCEERSLAVCEGTTTVVRTIQTSGRLRDLNCRPINIAAAGESRPGCTDVERSAQLSVGLAHCG